MAVTIPGTTGNYLARTGLWSGDGSISLWINIIAKSTYNTGLQLGYATAPGDILYLAESTAALTYYTHFGGTLATGSTLSINQWYHIALSLSGTTALVYVDGILDITLANANNAWNDLRIGQNAQWGEPGNFRAAGVKTWGAALTADELRQEMHVIRPIRTSNLVGFWPLIDHADTVDYSGAGNDLSATGTLTTSDGPPVSWGSPIWVLPFVAAGGGDITGTATITQAGNTVASAGGVAVVGSSALTQEANTVTATATAAVVGASSMTQDAQIVASVGIVAIAGAASITQDGQTVAAAGAVTIVGAAAITQDGQTVAAAGVIGSVPITGAAVITQDGQTVSVAGIVAIAGAATITQNGQTVATAGAVTIVGAAVITQDGQTVAAGGNVGNVPIVGAAALTQDGQTVAAAGAVAIVGAASMTQASQTVAAAGVVAVVGSAALTQAGQTVAATAALDLVLAVVYGAVLGVRSTGKAQGSQAAGTVAGSKATGSM